MKPTKKFTEELLLRENSLIRTKTPGVTKYILYLFITCQNNCESDHYGILYGQSSNINVN